MYNFLASEPARTATEAEAKLYVSTQIGIRVCTERDQSGSGTSEPGDHNPGHSEVDKSLTAGVRALKIAREPTVMGGSRH